MERLEKQMQFILEIDKIKEIYRQTYLSSGSRRENDAEHSWHMAVMAVLLEEYAPHDTYIPRVIKMILIHDVVEIDAGDTYAYDAAAKETQRAREEAAAERLFHLLPADQAAEYRALWEEFEAYETKEARFARALDNCQPLLLNAALDGRSWREHQVHKSQILKRNARTPDDVPVLWAYMEKKIQENIEAGNILPD